MMQNRGSRSELSTFLKTHIVCVLMSARPIAGAAGWQIYIADAVAVELLEWTIKPVFIRLELTYFFFRFLGVSRGIYQLRTFCQLLSSIGF